MKTKSILCVITALLLVWSATQMQVYAERSIYIGDLITLEIATKRFSIDELKEKFREFEIVELKGEKGGYFLSLRTFEPGEYTILLGDKEIIIDVRSTLDDIQREDLFEGDMQIKEPGFSFYWRIPFCIATGIFILSGGFILIKYILKRRIKAPNMYQIFLKQAEALSVEDDNFFVDLTFYFKEYIGSLYQCRIIGKTSAEIIDGLSEIQALNNILPSIKAWLDECDRFKFTGVFVPIVIKQEHYKELIALVQKIKEGAA